ncbi:hypothetical protein B0H14DRAFT_244307 [Mycena olivaceomarginata]|nr:hypothetical protein B0H14DRAFT_244307 [Mycena olivaceomarginata]
MSTKEEPVNLGHYANSRETSLPRGTRARRLFCCLVATLILVSFGLRVTRPEKPAALVTNLIDIAEDPRLEPYQTLDDAQECAEWPTSSDSNISTVSFGLLNGADLLFVLSRGPVIGHFKMIRRTNYSYPGVEPYINVEVTTQYHDEAVLRRTKVCRMGNEARNERGVLVWAEPGHPSTSVNVTVIIPLHLRSHKDISTDLAAFSHDISGNFDDWWSPTYFRDLRFKSSDAPIQFPGLRGRSAAIQTSNGEVRGYFSGKEIQIQTRNAPIGVFAVMSDLDGEITLHTSNGTIEGTFAVGDRLVNRTIRAHVHTSHAAIRLDTDPFLETPANSSLILDVSTSEAPVSVYLGPSYEGTYDLQTTQARAEVVPDPSVEDPSEMGRRRTVHRTASDLHEHVWGHTYWSFDGEPSSEGINRGSVSIRSTESDITLYC